MKQQLPMKEKFAVVGDTMTTAATGNPVDNIIGNNVAGKLTPSLADSKTSVGGCKEDAIAVELAFVDATGTRDVARGIRKKKFLQKATTKCPSQCGLQNQQQEQRRRGAATVLPPGDVMAKIQAVFESKNGRRSSYDRHDMNNKKEEAPP